jgi:6-phosphofructokinase
VPRLKGKAIIGQSGGPTAVINESLVGAVLEGRRHPEITGFYGALHGIQGMLAEQWIDLGAESEETLELVAKTPSAALGSVRKKPSSEDCQALLAVLQRHDIRYLFYIGGNDSAETAHIIDQLARGEGYDFKICHIPKTIDNDLRVTDHSPGYGSAARFVALALMGDNLDNRALKGVKIDVIMGRHAGFLTAAAALGRRDPYDGPHLVCVPEVPFEVERFCADVGGCLSRWGRCLVAVSEGIAHADGSPIINTGERDAHGNIQLSGSGAVGDFLAGEIREKLGVKRVRADTFGYLQRSFPTVISPVDAREAREAGAFAVRAMTGKAGDAGVPEGIISGSVSFRRLSGRASYACEMFLTELENVARQTRSLPAEFLAGSGSDVTPAFFEYALPLIGELPRFGRLRGIPAAPGGS